MKKVITPFSSDTIEFLSKWQRNSLYHPYTCGGWCKSGTKLEPRQEGLVCIKCGYTQTWAFVGENDEKVQ